MTVKDGSTVLATGTLNAGAIATFSTSTLGVGNHTITTVYNGDGNFKVSTATALGQTVNQASTSTRLTSSLNPSVYGQAVTFTATVTANSPGAGTPAGTVTFKDGTTALATGTLDASGRATFSTSSLSVGNHSITAVYGGNTNYRASASTKLTQKVNAAGTASTLTSSANPSVYGLAVTLTPTATAVSPGAGISTGTVTFKDGATSTGRQHARRQWHIGPHNFVLARRQMLDHRRLQKGTPIDKARTSAKLTQTVNAQLQVAGNAALGAHRRRRSIRSNWPDPGEAGRRRSTGGAGEGGGNGFGPLESRRSRHLPFLLSPAAVTLWVAASPTAGASRSMPWPSSPAIPRTITTAADSPGGTGLHQKLGQDQPALPQAGAGTSCAGPQFPLLLADLLLARFGPTPTHGVRPRAMT